VNRREGWTGHLWQGRFASFAMDARHTVAAARYVELNPVRAGLVHRPGEYPWSSARAHLAARDDALVMAAPLLERVRDWSAFLGARQEADLADRVRKHASTGRPLGSDAFVGELERQLNRSLRKGKPGRAPQAVTPDVGRELSRVSPFGEGGGDDGLDVGAGGAQRGLHLLR